METGARKTICKCQGENTYKYVFQGKTEWLTLGYQKIQIMRSQNLLHKSTASKSLSLIKKAGLLLLGCAVILYLFLSVKFLLS